MSGRLSAGAEVARRRNQSPAKVMLPDAVDHDAGGQRVGRTSQPLGKFQSSASLAVPRQFLATEDLPDPARNFFAELMGFTAFLQAGICGLAIGYGVGSFNVRGVGDQFVALCPCRLVGGL